ncbi:MAG: hypothetical protein KDC49_17440 [Saprospiraceae bacterium]|nr:hypothetical protein [Saprospiraceae bacterium]
MSTLDTRLDGIVKAVEQLLMQNLQLKEENLKLREALNDLKKENADLGQRADISTEGIQRNIKLRSEVDEVINEVKSCIALVKSME